MKHVAVLLFLAASACAVETETGTTEQAVTDPIQSCPIPDEHAIAGHEAVFYTCAEETAHCGPTGYLTGYGAKYATRFYRDTRPRMTSRGQQWIDDVLVCLQTNLRDTIDSTTSCDDIRTIAFDEHPACYVDAGFCTLSPWDIAQVVWTIDLRDWASRAAAKQVVTTALDCGNQYASTIRALFWYLL
ncbi:MAG TPA: hypothetical protein VL463_26320 [Kofleriaceae bacterium]|nr:hypothetical protein [Kofleriaceae bacterium]